MSQSPESSESSKKQRTEREDEEVLHRDPSYFQYYSQLQHQVQFGPYSDALNEDQK
ncbi:hypothetical protein IWW50_000430 [Coemansia erecta]|nr:hypothetical protein IWW50_000430 [Coemansia erecta]